VAVSIQLLPCWPK